MGGFAKVGFRPPRGRGAAFASTPAEKPRSQCSWRVRSGRSRAAWQSRLISSTHEALANAGADPVDVVEPVGHPSSAQIKKSISDAGLVSFIDGKTYQSLKRHLTRHGYTPASYRETFGLRADYPMISPVYAAKRSALAKAIGLGQGGRRPKGLAASRSRRAAAKA